MSLSEKEKKELWVAWTRDAAGRYEIPEKVESAKELVDDMIDITTDYADGMLDEFEKRFEGGSGRKRGRGKRRGEEDEDEDEDEDD